MDLLTDKCMEIMNGVMKDYNSLTRKLSRSSGDGSEGRSSKFDDTVEVGKKVIAPLHISRFNSIKLTFF